MNRFGQTACGAERSRRWMSSAVSSVSDRSKITCENCIAKLRGPAFNSVIVAPTIELGDLASLQTHSLHAIAREAEAELVRRRRADL
jgi:hypothetical protein